MRNINFRKKFLSMLTAGMIMATPVAASASSYDDEEEISFADLNYEEKSDNSTTLLTDEEMLALASLECQEVKTSMTMIDYAKLVKDNYEYLNTFKCFAYDHMKQDIQCLVYLASSKYISEEVKEELINNGYISDDFSDNFTNASNLLNCINIHNQNTIRTGYECGKINKEQLINVSAFCFDSHDKKIVDLIHNNYVSAYENGRFPNKYFDKAFNELTNVSNPCGGNVYQISVGARWIAQFSIGTNMIRLLKDDMQDDFTNQELYEYFIQEDYNNGQWNQRKDISLDLNCLKNELEVEVFTLGQAREFFVKKVNNDLVSYEEESCKTKTR